MNKRIILTGFLVILVSILIWGFAVEPYTLDRRELRVEIPNLPPSWEGRKIAVLGDFQIGMWLDNDRTVRRAINEAIREEPAAVMILGDFVYHAAQAEGNQVAMVAEMVKPLIDAGIPTYAVLGNHDYAVTEMGGPRNEELAQRLRDTMEALGVRMLQNESVPLGAPAGEEVPGETLYLVGIGPHWPQKADPQVALQSVPEEAARLVMMHNPDTFPLITEGAAPFAVAGHTHGGQVRIPGFPHWSILTLFTPGEIHMDGWIPDYGQAGNQLYVNRGIGMSLVPIRIYCPPEMTVLLLTGT